MSIVPSVGAEQTVEPDLAQLVIRQRRPDKRNDHVFVTYPYTLYPHDDYRGVFSRVEQVFKVRFVFANEELTSVPLLDKIINMMRFCRFGIYEVSGSNANVALELGVAMGLREEVVLAFGFEREGRPDALSNLRGINHIQWDSFAELEEDVAALLEGMGFERRLNADVLELPTVDPTPGEQETRALNKVFICYAREDGAIADALYEQLLGAGFEPWMDKRDLRGGELWDYAIQGAIRRSDFFVVLLSESSVRKRGYLQREVKVALEICDKMLTNDIFLIPVRLDGCAVPESLAIFQWEDLSITDLVQSLQEGRTRRVR